MIEIIPNWHPIFVHFSVGLLLTSALFHIAVTLTRDEALKQTFTHVANWNLWVGTGLSIATVAAGWVAYNTVTHDTPSHLVMIEHRNLALGTFVLAVAVAIWSAIRARKGAPIHMPLVIAVCIVGGLLISTAWHGGELVYRHGLGVMSLPNPDDHAHSEGEAHVHEHDHGHDTATSESADHPHDDSNGHDHDHEMEASPELPDTADQIDSNSSVSDESNITHTHEPGHEH